MTEKEIYLEAIRRYGKTAQLTMVIEETSELQKEICKHFRGKQNHDKIAEEIADVLITIRQAVIILDIRDKVEEFKVEKINRLEMKLNGPPEVILSD